MQRQVGIPPHFEREERAAAGTSIGIGDEVLVQMHLRSKIVRLEARAPRVGFPIFLRRRKHVAAIATEELSTFEACEQHEMIANLARLFGCRDFGPVGEI